MERFELPDLRLSSRHLKELKLTNLGLHGSFLDFSNCPELEDLEIDDCIITADRILCPFVKRLKFYISFFHSDVRTPRIYVPSLISLNLDHSGMSPLLDSMPSLVTAFVQFRTAHERYRPVTAGNDEGEYLIFEGLSNTTHLKLVSTHYDVIFRRDSTRRPLFRKLKTLFVKCVEADLRTLVFFLQHSPILEKLTLHCYSVIEDNLDIEGSCGTKEELFASKHLKIVEIKCPNFSQTTQKITKILSTYGIPLDQINIRETG